MVLGVFCIESPIDVNLSSSKRTGTFFFFLNCNRSRIDNSLDKYFEKLLKVIHYLQKFCTINFFFKMSIKLKIIEKAWNQVDRCVLVTV